MASTNNDHDRAIDGVEVARDDAPGLDAEGILEVVSTIEGRLEEVRRIHEQQEAERAALAQREAEAAERERLLAERARRIAELTRELEERRAALDAERETAVMELEAARADLASARARAAETAADVRAAPGEAERAEARCVELEEECERLRKRIEEMRDDPYRQQAERDEARARRASRQARWSSAMRSCALALIWMSLAGLVAHAGWIGLTYSSPEQAAMSLGLGFAAVFFGAMTVARRLLDPPALAIGALGATFGIWFPEWVGAIELAIQTWSLPLGGLPEAVIPMIPISFAVATSSLAMAVALFALTGSGTVLLLASFAAAACSLLAIMPDRSGVTVFGAAVLWNALIATGLTRWAIGVRGGTPGASVSTVGE
ncbi:MAG: hypothetical protein KIS87_10225 [Phycisphaeraceae bacterium]|nr:hypothetical protein [Phycisphaeraceae bacterium]